jgi:hypothetical protein
MRVPWNRKSVQNFAKKEEHTQPDLPTKPVPDWVWRWENIRPLCPIGLHFKLLGKEMIVSKYVNISHDSEVPGIECLYFDNNGKLLDVLFEPSDWECLESVLKNQTTRTHKMIS